MEIESDEKCRVCYDCKEAFSTEADFEVHLCFHTKKCCSLCSTGKMIDNDYHCCLCEEKFDRITDLMSHISIHTGEKPHSCPYCSFTSSTLNYLNVHIVRSHAKEFKHICSFCSKGFVHKSELLRHIRSSHLSEDEDKSTVVKKEPEEAGENQKQPDQMHSCSMCTYVSNFKTNLVRHLWTHCSDKPYQCKLCDRGFTQKESYSNHLRTHTGERPFVCNTCGRRFISKANLRVHEKLHPEEKIYLKDPQAKPFRNVKASQSKCVFCQKTFCTEKKLIDHVRVHLNPFECDTCEKGFSSKKALSNHKRVHLDVKIIEMHRCPLCPFSTSQKFSLRVHLQTHSEKRLKNRKEKRANSEKIHLNPFKCDTCEKGFSTQTALSNHERLHSEVRIDEMHRCLFCPFSTSQEFSLRVHLQTHSDKKLNNFVCQFCNIIVSDMEKHVETCKGKKLLKCKFCSKYFIKKELVKHRTVCTHKHPFVCSTCGRGFYTRSYLEFHETMHSTAQRQKTPDVKKEPQNPTHSLVTSSSPKQTQILQKPSTVNFKPVPIQNQLIILQPAVILKGTELTFAKTTRLTSANTELLSAEDNSAD